MEEKSTGDLSQELMRQPDLNAYIHENSGFFAERDFAELLTGLYDKKDITKVMAWSIWHISSIPPL